VDERARHGGIGRAREDAGEHLRRAGPGARREDGSAALPARVVGRERLEERHQRGAGDVRHAHELVARPRLVRVEGAEHRREVRLAEEGPVAMGLEEERAQPRPEAERIGLGDLEREIQIRCLGERPQRDQSRGAHPALHLDVREHGDERIAEPQRAARRDRRARDGPRLLPSRGRDEPLVARADAPG